jgi:YVTN family beta-propeller protein
MRPRTPSPARIGFLAWALACAAALTVATAPAAARDAYVANSGNGTVSVLDLATGAPVGAVAVGGKPVDVAITPDGGRAYVVDEQRGLVLGILTATNTTFAAIPVGKEPRGIAITPDRAAAYVTNFGDGSVSVINLATNATLPTAIPVGAEPEGIAVSRDGRYAYVARRGGGIAILDLAAGRVVGVVPDGFAPSRIALGPNGGRAFVANATGSVSVFNLATGGLVGGPVPLPAPATGVAVAPDGHHAYVATPSAGAVSVIDTSRAAVVGAIGSLPGAGRIAFEPSGAHGLATVSGGTGASVFGAATGRGVASLPTGPEPEGIAVVPNQGPTASFAVLPALRVAKRKLTFAAYDSSDPDGKIATYAWDWGDGHHVKTSAKFKWHRYAKPGTYTATLTVTDDEGCSSELVFTGQTASCVGTPRAVASVPVEVVDPKVPGLRLAGGQRQRVRGVVNVFAKCRLADCGLRARGTITARFRRGDSPRTYRLHIGPVVESVGARSWSRVRLSLPRGQRRAVLRALRAGGNASANLTVVARDVHGIRNVRHRQVGLVLGGRQPIVRVRSHHWRE